MPLTALAAHPGASAALRDTLTRTCLGEPRAHAALAGALLSNEHLSSDATTALLQMYPDDDLSAACFVRRPGLTRAQLAEHLPDLDMAMWLEVSSEHHRRLGTHAQLLAESVVDALLAAGTPARDKWWTDYLSHPDLTPPARLRALRQLVVRPSGGRGDQHTLLYAATQHPGDLADLTAAAGTEPLAGGLRNLALLARPGVSLTREWLDTQLNAARNRFGLARLLTAVPDPYLSARALTHPLLDDHGACTIIANTHAAPEVREDALAKWQQSPALARTQSAHISGHAVTAVLNAASEQYVTAFLDRASSIVEVIALLSCSNLTSTHLDALWAKYRPGEGAMIDVDDAAAWLGTYPTASATQRATARSVVAPDALLQSAVAQVGALLSTGSPAAAGGQIPVAIVAHLHPFNWWTRNARLLVDAYLAQELPHMDATQSQAIVALAETFTGTLDELLHTSAAMSR